MKYTEQEIMQMLEWKGFWRMLRWRRIKVHKIKALQIRSLLHRRGRRMSMILKKKKLFSRTKDLDERASGKKIDGEFKDSVPRSTLHQSHHLREIFPQHPP